MCPLSQSQEEGEPVRVGATQSPLISRETLVYSNETLLSGVHLPFILQRGASSCLSAPRFAVKW